MSPGLAALAVAVVVGGIIAVSSREARVAVLGLILAGVTAPLIGDPLPDPLALASRVIAMVLGGYLLWVALRGVHATAGSPLGWPVETLIAAAAAIAGFGAIQLVFLAGPRGLPGAEAPGALFLLGPREALAAGTALAVLGLAPVLVSRDVLRLGIGLTLGVVAAGLLRVGLAGSPTALEQVVMAGLGLAIAVGTATIARQAIRTGGGLEVGPEVRPAAAPGRPSGAEPADHVTPRSGTGRRSIPGR
jgi:hypothetical protein